MKTERPSHQTAPTSPSVSKSLRASVEKHPLSAREKTLIEQICFAWAEHQGWPKGRWPRERRFDAVQITLWARRLGGSIDRWKQAIARVPHDAAFTALTTSPERGRVCLLEEVLIDSRGREAAWAQEKKQQAEGAKSIGQIMREAIKNAH
jgi:hypothetical protein